MITFTIPGKPVAKGRPRVSTFGGRVRSFTPAKTVAYEGLVAFAGQDAMCGRSLLEGAVSLRVEAIFEIPASWPKRKRADAAAGTVRPTGKPDADNILKAIGDGLNGVVWRDDSQIVEATITKRYGDTPHVSVSVEQK